MRKLTTIFLAGLLLTASVLFVSATVGTAQIQEQDEDILRQLPIPKNHVVVTSVLVGRMLDSSGTPISGVWIDCTGPSGTTGFVTGPDGAYRFNLSQTGHYVIRPHVPDTSYSPSQADFYVIIPGADFVRY
jgi:hypothetical protein